MTTMKTIVTTNRTLCDMAGSPSIEQQYAERFMLLFLKAKNIRVAVIVVILVVTIIVVIVVAIVLIIVVAILLQSCSCCCSSSCCCRYSCCCNCCYNCCHCWLLFVVVFVSADDGIIAIVC